MIVRIILSVVIGLVTWAVFWLIGVGLALIAPIAPLGLAIQSIAWLFGILGGVWYFFVGQNLFNR